MNDIEKKAQDEAFYTMADKFIDVGNTECDENDPSFVGSAMLFATARYSAFVVASQAHDQASYESELDRAAEFFKGEFERMLKQNLNDYKTAFVSNDSAGEEINDEND